MKSNNHFTCLTSQGVAKTWWGRTCSEVWSVVPAWHNRVFHSQVCGWIKWGWLTKPFILTRSELLPMNTTCSLTQIQNFSTPGISFKVVFHFRFSISYTREYQWIKNPSSISFCIKEKFLTKYKWQFPTMIEFLIQWPLHNFYEWMSCIECYKEAACVSCLLNWSWCALSTLLIWWIIFWSGFSSAVWCKAPPL